MMYSGPAAIQGAHRWQGAGQASVQGRVLESRLGRRDALPHGESRGVRESWDP